MVIVIALILILLIGLFWNNKYMFIAQMVLIWFIMGWNSGGMDYDGNEQIFLQSGRYMLSESINSWLYNLIAYFCHQHNLDFITFNAITVLIALAIIAFVVLKETDNPCLFTLFFVLYPMLDSIVQKRYFFGMAYSFLGFYFLKRRKKIGFVVSVVLALGCHFSFIIYFPLLLWNQLKKEKEQKRFIVLICVVEVAVLFLTPNLLSRFVSDAKLTRYLFRQSYELPIIGIIFLILQASYIAFFMWVSRILRKNHELNKNNLALLDFVDSINTVSIILCPLCLFETVYMRYYRIVFMYQYLVLSTVYGEEIIRPGLLIIKKKHRWIRLFSAYVVLTNIAIYILSNQGLQGYVKTMMINSLF